MVDALHEMTIQCPYCGEPITLLIDGSAAPQEYIEDCEVCCRPIEVHSSIDADGEVSISALHENE